MIGATDTGALERRIEAHARFASRDLAPWVLAQLDLRPGLRVLELGCGTGRQTLPLAEAMGETGRVTAVDVSADALARLGEAARAAGVARRISPLRRNFDDLAARPPHGSFDRVMSCYALYYAADPRAVLHAVRDTGLLFVCGPGRGNNLGLRRLHHGLLDGGAGDDPAAAVFMEEKLSRIVGELFGEHERLEFENVLRFDSAEALCSYWSAYHLYDPALEPRFRAAAADHFREHAGFETVKRTVAIRAVRG